MAFFFVDHVGRRVTLIAGGICMAIAMGVLGGLGMSFAVEVPSSFNVSTNVSSVANVTIDNPYAGWLCVTAIYFYVFGFAWSWGPVCWLYPTEVLPTSQRAKGVALTTASKFFFFSKSS